MQPCGALLAFLAAHGRHVRQLHLNIEEDDEDEDEATAIAIFTTVASCLGACGAAGSLEQLQIAPETPALEQLSLAGSRVNLGAVRLPPSLTRLRIEDASTQELPLQLTRLSALRPLDLLSAPYSAASLDPLSKLGSLEHLFLDGVAAPPCLPRLTQLHTLAVVTESGVEDVLAAVPCLTGLTCLQLAEVASFPHAVASLPRLQRLCLWSQDGTVADPAVPAGPWLQSIKWFGAPWAFLEAGTATLAAAQQLEYLSAFTMPHAGIGAAVQHWAAFWELAAMHPSLRCLGIDTHCSDDLDAELATPSVALLDALFHLKHRRPGLQLRRTPQDGSEGFWDECLECHDIPAGPS
ncbi:hypothetical protein ABPG75_005472 [Micractinium tetrahymenae]